MRAAESPDPIAKNAVIWHAIAIDKRLIADLTKLGKIDDYAIPIAGNITRDALIAFRLLSFCPLLHDLDERARYSAFAINWHVNPR